MNILNQQFFQEVANRFDFLVELQYKKTSFQNNELLVVKYEKFSLFTTINFEKRSQQVYLEICINGQNFSFENFLKILKIESDSFMVKNLNGLKISLSFFSDHLKMVINSDLWKSDNLFNLLLNQNQINASELEKASHVSAFRHKAIEAFSSKNYAMAIGFFKKYEHSLTKVEQAQLAYAEKRVSN